MRKILLPLTILVICILGIYIYGNLKLESPSCTATSKDRFTLYEDNELNYKNTNRIFFIIIAVFTFAFGTINSRIKTIKKDLKNNEENLNIKLKKLNILKYVLIAIYLIIGVYFLFVSISSYTDFTKTIKNLFRKRLHKKVSHATIQV